MVSGRSVSSSGNARKSKEGSVKNLRPAAAEPVKPEAPAPAAEAVKSQKAAPSPAACPPPSAGARVADMKKSRSLQERLSDLSQAGGSHRLHVGLDVHKREWHVAIWDKESDLLVESWVSPPESASLLKTLGVIRPLIERVVYEAGPTGFSLARQLQSDQWPVHVISPAHTPGKAAGEDKSDRLDARKLAEYSSKHLLHPIAIPTLQEDSDRALTRLYEEHAKASARAKIRIKSFLLYHGVPEPAGLRFWSLEARAALKTMTLPPELRLALDLHLEALAQAEKLRLHSYQAMKQLASAERHAANVARLRTVPGVGLIVAITFLTEIFNPGRFPSCRQVSRMLGLAPEVRSSGMREERAGRHKAGQERLRSLLIEAAWRWCAVDNHAWLEFDHHARRVGLKQKAITAMARKLGVLLWRLSQSAVGYCPGARNIPPGVAEGMRRRKS